MVQQIASQPDIFRLAFHHPTSLLANSHVDIDDKGHFSISFFFLFGGRKCWKRFDAVLFHLFLLYVCFPFSVERGGTCATGLSIGCKIAIEFFQKSGLSVDRRAQFPDRSTFSTLPKEEKLLYFFSPLKHSQKKKMKKKKKNLQVTFERSLLIST